MNVINEMAIVNEIASTAESSKGALIVEAAKAALRSDILSTDNKSANSSAVEAPKADVQSFSTPNSTLKVEGNSSVNASALDASSGEKPTAKETNAKTFIARSQQLVSKNQQPAVKGQQPVLLHKSQIDNSAVVKNILQKGPSNSKLGHELSVTRGTLHASIVPESAPAMQKGSLAIKLPDTRGKAETKSTTANIIAPLTNAIKSLDSATKLLGAATANRNGVGASANVVNSAGSAPVLAQKAAALLPAVPVVSNKTVVEESSSTRTASAKPASAAAPAPVAKAPVATAPDPYAEIASGPDSPKTPELKTGTDKAGLPVMKMGPNSEPESVSFDKADSSPEPVPVQSDSPNRPGPQDVGGILDKLTDKLNKGI